ncbi:MAG: hypothetical protein PHO32_03085 [Candidatus Cloacimonetes bacterium]|nr:hypothetical protein [Candidatus Cloacimonadota bacterium]
MKKLTMLLIFTLALIALTAATVGKIRFILGEVFYKETQSQIYKTAILNANVSEDGFIKTGLDASAEIEWNSGVTSTVKANTQISISKLLQQANSNPTWKNKMKESLNNLKLQNPRNASSVAGIRRDEAEVKKENSLLWFQDPLQSMEDAIALYEAKDFPKAITAFQKVINQGPLKKDAEHSHAYLIMIYDEQNDKVNQQKHIELLKSDFPDSALMENLPVDK